VLRALEFAARTVLLGVGAFWAVWLGRLRG